MNDTKHDKQPSWHQRLVRLLRRVSFDRLGVEFPWNGDTVIWLWWWRRNGLPKYISVGFSGTGEFGDARFHTLAELRQAWDDLGDYRSMPFSAQRPSCVASARQPTYLTTMETSTHQETTENVTSADVGTSALLEPKPRKRVGLLAPMLMATALVGVDGFGGLWRSRTSSQKVRNDPRREKTSADLAALAAASEKRARKEAARERQRLLSKGSNVKDERRR